MAWTLQPRSYMQVIRPNLYNLAYRRTGAYKGMGSLGQVEVPPPGTTGGPCPGSPGCPGYVDPYQNLSTTMEGVLIGQNVFMTTDAYNQLLRGSVTQPATTITNYLPWILGVGLLLVLAASGGRR